MTGYELPLLQGVPVAGFKTFVAIAEIQGAESREWTYICKDGTRQSVKLSVTVQKDSNASIIGYLGTATDITDRKSTEAAWRSTSRFLDGLSKLARVGGWKLDVTIAWTYPGQGSCFRLDIPLKLVKGSRYVRECIGPHHCFDRPRDVRRSRKMPSGWLQ